MTVLYRFHCITFYLDCVYILLFVVVVGTLLREPFISKTAIEEDESIRDFILRRFGQEVRTYVDIQYIK